MSITFTQTNTIDFDEAMFQEEFAKELKAAAAEANIPYKTGSEQTAFVELIWARVIDEVGDTYDMNDDGDDNDSLDQRTAGYAIHHDVKQVIADYVKSVKVAKKGEAMMAAVKVLTEEDETDGWEEVYNAGNQTKGNPLGVERRKNPLLPGQEGIFYQTYGNGGGAGGWGGYWAMPGAVWETPGVYQVAGEEFTLLDGVVLEFRPENCWTGRVAAVRILPLTQERIAEALRKHTLYQEAVAKREARLAQRDEETIETKYEREQQRLAEEVLRLRLEKQIPSGFEAAVAEAAQYLLKKAKASAAAEVAE